MSPQSGNSRTIRVAAAIIFSETGHVLLARKRGSPVFMQPGGKIEPGETASAALVRELREEIGLAIESDKPLYLGKFTAEAANEAGRLVEAETFEIPLYGRVTAAGEIEEIVWVDPFGPLDLPLAMLSREHMMPLARQRRPR